MAKSIAQIQKQIADLQRQADEIRKREIGGVVARIREAIAHYGLTADDLFAAAAPSSKAKRRKASASGVEKSKPASKSAVKPKYRDENGNTWSGRGRQPRWLVAAIAAGKTPADFKIAD